MKILITGANGLLGQHLIKLLLEETRHTILATGRGACRLPFELSDLYEYFPLDITDGVAVQDFFRAHRPDIVVHLAAITQPDPCELHPVECWNTNVTATRFLLGAAEETNTRFIYLSTDFVFDGEAGPYCETDIPGPVNFYGSSKLAAEKAVQESRLQWAIIRTVLVYGNVITGTRSNIISWVKDNLSAGNPIKVVKDQVRTPTYVEDLAHGILLVIEKKAAGIYHISGEEVLTPYDMALSTAGYLGMDASLMTSVNAETFTQPARRPLKTGFIIDKAKRELGYQPVPFRIALAKMLEAQ